MCLSSCCHRITLKGPPSLRNLKYVYIEDKKGLSDLKTNEYPAQKSFCVVGWHFLFTSFYHYSSLFRRGQLEDLCQNTKVALKVVEKCSRGLLLAVRRYGYHGKPVVSFFFIFWGGRGKAEVYIQFLHCTVENPQVFKPWINLKLSMFSVSMIHHWSRWRYIIQHKL